MRNIRKLQYLYKGSITLKIKTVAVITKRNEKKKGRQQAKKKRRKKLQSNINYP